MLFDRQNSMEQNFPSLPPLQEDFNQPQQPQACEQPIQRTISVEALFEAKRKLIKFVQGLHQYRKSELRPDVLAHCSQLNKSRRVIASYISDETIVRMVGGRIDKMLKNRKIKKNWSEEDLKILVWIVSKYADVHCFVDLQKDFTHEDWEVIAQMIPGVNAGACMFKWLSIKKVNLSVQHWNEDEAHLLRDLVREQLSIPGNHPNILNWKFISQKLYSINQNEMKIFRSAKQCREHWNCYLNPTLKKGPWNIEEDIQLLELIKNNNGEKKWSEIVYSFEGRTQNALKNRYTLLIDKQKKISKCKQERSLIEDCLQKCKQTLNINLKENKDQYISQILNQQKQNEQPVNNVQQVASEPSSHQINESHRADSQTFVETPSSQPQMMIRICKMEQFDFLRHIAMSREVKPGVVKNNVFQPQQ